MGRHRRGYDKRTSPRSQDGAHESAGAPGRRIFGLARVGRLRGTAVVLSAWAPEGETDRGLTRRAW